jgi:hypothetical protein
MTGLMTLAVAALACGGSDGPMSPTGPTPSSPPLSQLALFPTRFVALVGDRISLKVIARDVGGADVSSVVVPSYASSDPGVVAIEPDGRIVSRAVGTATVRASAGGQSAEAVIHVGSATFGGGREDLRVLEANYIDLSKIGQISRFRSTIGHSYTDGSEECRSMKHYFQPRLFTDWTTVDIYAPASGTIFVIAADGGIGSRILLRPRDLPVLQLAIFHVNLDPGIERNSWVNAGDHIGRHASSGTMSDIAVSIGPKEGGMLFSYFEAMTDAVFAQYQARGVGSRQAAIITKEERDADPVPCVGEQQFTVRGRLPDWLVLN